MSILDRFKRLFGVRDDTLSSNITPGSPVYEALTGIAGLRGAPSVNGALAVTAVAACVNLIAGAHATLPVVIYDRSEDGDLTRNYKSPLWWILNEEMHPRWSANTGWNYLVASKLLRGDAFARILRDNAGQITGLLPIHPLRVWVIAHPDGGRLIYRVTRDMTILQPTPEQAKTIIVDQDDMLHVPGDGFDGLHGMSMLRSSLSKAGRLAINAQDFSTTFLENMARPDYALATEQALSDPQFARLREQMDDHKGTMNGGKPIILEGGLKIEPLTMPLAEMQLLETRKFQVEEIARAFGVQPFMIGQTEKTSSWGTGVQAMGAGFVRYTLRPHLDAFRAEINRKFFRTAARYADFDTFELERGDFTTMMAAVRVGLGRAGEPAVMSIEEGRQMLHMPRKISGTVPQNPKKGTAQ